MTSNKMFISYIKIFIVNYYKITKYKEDYRKTITTLNFIFLSLINNTILLKKEKTLASSITRFSITSS